MSRNGMIGNTMRHYEKLLNSAENVLRRPIKVQAIEKSLPFTLGVPCP
jgi:hypothetical protein